MKGKLTASQRMESAMVRTEKSGERVEATQTQKPYHASVCENQKAERRKLMCLLGWGHATFPARAGVQINTI